MTQEVATYTGPHRRDPLEFRALVEPGADLRLLLRTVEVEGGTAAIDRLALVPGEAALADAKGLLMQLDAACMSGALARDNPDVVRVWLTSLNAGQFKPLTERSLLDVMLPALLLACGDLPQRCFSRESLAEALRTVRFINVAEIDGLVRPLGEAILRRRAVIRDIVTAGAPLPVKPPPEPDLTPSQRDEILERFHRQMEQAGLTDDAASTVQHAPLAPIAMDLDAKISRARDRLTVARMQSSPMVGYFEQVLKDLELRQGREGS